MPKEPLSEKVKQLHEEACAAGKKFYVDPETKMLVTTRTEHLARGSCCKSGCRHCPYGFQSEKFTPSV